jgi:hypothetical protein
MSSSCDFFPYPTLDYEVKALVWTRPKIMVHVFSLLWGMKSYPPFFIHFIKTEKIPKSTVGVSDGVSDWEPTDWLQEVPVGVPLTLRLKVSPKVALAVTLDMVPPHLPF